MTLHVGLEELFVKQDTAVAGSRTREAAVLRVYSQTDEEDVCAAALYSCWL